MGNMFVGLYGNITGARSQKWYLVELPNKGHGISLQLGPRLVDDTCGLWCWPNEAHSLHVKLGPFHIPDPREDPKSRISNSGVQHSYGVDYRTLRWIYSIRPGSWIGGSLRSTNYPFLVLAFHGPHNNSLFSNSACVS